MQIDRRVGVSSSATLKGVAFTWSEVEEFVLDAMDDEYSLHNPARHARHE